MGLGAWCPCIGSTQSSCVSYGKSALLTNYPPVGRSRLYLRFRLISAESDGSPRTRGARSSVGAERSERLKWIPTASKRLASPTGNAASLGVKMGASPGAINATLFPGPFYHIPEGLFPQPVLIGITAVCVLLFSVGVAGNVMTILLVARYRDMKTSTNFFLCSMAMSDLLIFLCMPLDLYKLWRLRPWLLGQFVCKLSQFVSEGCTYGSTLHVTALSVERYVAVCFPLKAKVLLTRSRVKVAILALWTVALASAGPVFALVGVEFVNGTDPSETSECKGSEYGVRSGLLSAMAWVSSLYFLVPTCCLAVLYSLIGRKLWRRPKSRRDRSNRRTVKMLAVIVLVFVLCWLPFHIERNLLLLTAGSAGMYTVSRCLQALSFALFYLSAAINPVLYNLMSAKYRAAAGKLLGLRGKAGERRRGRWRKKRLQSPPHCSESGHCCPGGDSVV
ncbi:growth hormone secretagogue receptor type 1-like [Pristis pectinata]|uniref:growth hormone secretagogue receptor type 1-like n=1 Tax=Pristis pectinata TaxID=685728 RepID=UPI00223E43EF|nr:growth hormone secretagogue receptor type 1-like [Pristis pectinata]